MKGRIIRDNKKTKLPLIGKIKVGAKVQKGGKEFPTSLDYFVASGDYKHEFDKAFGDKPSKIEVVFMSDDFEAVCNERFEIRSGKKLYGYGDGKLFYIYDKKADTYLPQTLSANPKLMEDVASDVNSSIWDETTVSPDTSTET